MKTTINKYASIVFVLLIIFGNLVAFEQFGDYEPVTTETFLSGIFILIGSLGLLLELYFFNKKSE